MIKNKIDLRKENEKLIKDNFPDIEQNIKELGKKELTDEVATDVETKALEFLEANFSGKMLENLKKQLPKTIKELQKNTKR